MIFFTVLFLFAEILINIKGLKLKATLYTLLIFVIFFVLYNEFPLPGEVAVWKDHAVTESDGKSEIEISFKASRIEFSAPAVLTDQNGRIVQSDLQPGIYTVTYNNHEEELKSTVYVSTENCEPLIAFFFAFVAFWLVIVLCTARRLTVEKKFLLFVIPLVIIYLILFPPGAVPDARSHFMATYRFSNLLLGRPEWVARADDAFFFNHCWQHHVNTAVYTRVVESNFHFFVQDSALVPVEPYTEMSFYSFFSYLPQIIGVVAGRIFMLGTIPTLYFARILSSLTYILVIYWAIKKTPSGKHIMFLVAVLPISLMLAGSFSYDMMLIAASIAFISAVLNDSFIEIIVWAFLLGSIKGGSMLVLIPIVLILKNKWKVIITFVSAIISVFLFDWLLPQIGLFQFGTEGSGTYTAFYVFEKPIRFFEMLLKTYIEGADQLVGEALGSRLAWLIDTIPIVFVGALFVLGWIMASHEKDQKNVLTTRKWVWYIPVILSAAITPVMLLSFTPVGSDIIQGLQGRYYLPLLIPILFLISKQNFYAGENKMILNRCFQWMGIIMAICTCYTARMLFTTISSW